MLTFAEDIRPSRRICIVSEMMDAFKEAEKRYRKCRETVGRQRKRGQKSDRERNGLDMRDVFDPYVASVDVRFSQVAILGDCIFCHRTIPGCYVLKEALDLEDQLQLFEACLFDLPNPPATTNLTQHHGQLPDLASAAEKDLFLNTHRTSDRVDDETWLESPNGGPSAKSLFKKLRWISLGPHYDWTARTYDRTSSHRPLPESLISLWKKFATKVSQLEGAPAVDVGSPDVALVNYYAEGDTLGGHKDDAEDDLSKPIVCVSLGQPGIFLMGGETRDVSPTPILLRSGDVVVMSHQARRCFHGVPRVVNEGSPLSDAFLSRLEINSTDIKCKLQSNRISISIRSL